MGALVVALALFAGIGQRANAAVVTNTVLVGLWTITIDGTESVVITCVDDAGALEVRVNFGAGDVEPTTGTALCADVVDIAVTATGANDNTIDLSAVTFAAGFTNGFAPTPLIDAGDGNDNVLPSGFDDTIQGGAGTSDRLNYSNASAGVTMDISQITPQATGGSGSDTIPGGFENLTGSASGDILTGTSGANDIVGGGGNDQITGGANNDTLDGGAGNDQFLGLPNGDDTITEAAAADTDTLNFSNAASPATIDLSLTTAQPVNAGGEQITLTSGTGVEDVVGNDGQVDDVTGNSRDNNLQGQGGADVLSGAGGNDTLDGGTGGDQLTGGSGNDGLTGGAGNDQFLALPDGADTIDEAGGGADTINLSNANAATTLSLASTDVQTVTAQGSIDLNGAAEIENVTGSAQVDNLTGNGLANTVTGLGGNDTLIGGAAADALDGGADTDTVSYAGAAAVTIDLTNTVAATGGDAGGDTFTDVENAIGSSNGDSITGTAGVNTLQGSGGADTLNGGDGDDVLDGGAGDDTALNGQGGTDQITGGAGADAMTGGAGNDQFLALPDGADTINESGGGTDTINLSNAGATTTLDLSSTAVQTVTVGNTIQLNGAAEIENVEGSDTRADTITGNSLSNTINGNGGNDAVTVSLAGTDTVGGGNGTDSLTVNAGLGADTITTTNTTVSGGGASATYSSIDTLVVNTLDGNDSITVDGSNTTINAGTGNDTFTVNQTGSGHQLTLNGEGGADAYSLTNLDNISDVAGVSPDLTLDGGADADSLTFTCPAAVDQTVANQFTVTGRTVSHPNVETAPDCSALLTSADLGVTLSGPSEGRLGQQLAYAATVRNAGPSAASAVRLEVTRSAGLAGFAVSTTQGACTENDCSIGTLADGGSAVVTIRVQAVGSGSQSVSTRVTGTTTDNLAVNDSASVTTNVATVATPEPLPPRPGATPPAPGVRVFVRGTDRSETLHGGTENDILRAGGGNDRVFARGGNDRVFAGAGNDLVDADGGDDFVNLGEGADRARAGDGDDRVLGRMGDDRIYGGDGHDRLLGNQGDDLLFGGNGRDVLLGGPGDDRLSGGPRRDYLNGGQGDDHINSRDGIPERVLCGKGIDYVVADQFDTFVSCETGIVKPLPLRSLQLLGRSGR